MGYSAYEGGGADALRRSEVLLLLRLRVRVEACARAHTTINSCSSCSSSYIIFLLAFTLTFRGCPCSAGTRFVTQTHAHAHALILMLILIFSPPSGTRSHSSSLLEHRRVCIVVALALRLCYRCILQVLRVDEARHRYDSVCGSE